jgi:hypothetical protein
MISVTSYSNWERLNTNDNPSDRFNCFINTAAGLLGLGSVREFQVRPNLSEYVRSMSFENKFITYFSYNIF